MPESYLSPENYPFEPNSFVTMGAFDGLHFGHRQIINKVIEEAKLHKGVSVLITFNPHPQEVIQKGPAEFHLLTTLNEKLTILKQTGIDRILVLPFTRDFSELSAEQFIETILIGKVGLKKIWLGYDHGFGKNRQGSADILRAYGEKFNFEVEQVPAQEFNGIVASSTQIRKYILAGEVDQANTLLGYDYSLSGLVSRGERIGRRIGYPTANIFVENPKKLIPATGVYLVKMVVRGKEYPGMCNIGFRPTFNGTGLKIEVHLFDFNEDIYGVSVCVRFIQKIRDEQKFSGPDALVQQLKQDEASARALFFS
ncbi:MAG: bifunctional riboflavin kinase/FAD synthetase [Bacteroidetes bacterium]|nr:bifunctional riboflavin kinase/FAD synthetase [Bacteroidota bacterium]